MSDPSLFGELKKRRVFQVAAIYVAVAWGATEITVTIVEQLLLPGWVSTVAIIAFVVGFPIAMFLSWTFDITPDGIRRTTISSRRGKASIFSALALLILGTFVLFWLINPAGRTPGRADVPPNSLAVMPFENVGVAAGEEYLVAGLGDALRDQLGSVRGLRMAARSSSVSARGQDLDAVSASAALRVAYLVEGTVRKRGDNLIVSVQLINGADGHVEWNDVFDRSRRELVSVQQSITDLILQQIMPGELGSESIAPTNNESANEVLLLARYYEIQVRERREVDQELLSRAIELYRRATELDPESALAYSRLAGVLMYDYQFKEAQAPIFRASTLNPDLSEVQNTLGNYLHQTLTPGAGNAFRRAIELNPNNADALSAYAYWLWMQVRMDESVANYRRAFELDPLSLSRAGALGEIYAHSAMVDEAVEMAAVIESRFDNVDGYRQIAWLMELVGRLDHAIAWTIRARDLEPDNADHTEYLAALYVDLNDFRTARQLDAIDSEENSGLLLKMRRYEEFIDAAEFEYLEDQDNVELIYWLAYTYNIVGRSEDAVRFLSSAGLPDAIQGEVKNARDLEAQVTLIDALDQLGQQELAQQLANRWSNTSHAETDYYWVPLYLSCSLAVEGRDEEALNEIATISRSPRLPWEALIRDMPCFRRYAEEPVYLAMLQHFADRRESIRARLPATLAEYGVGL